MASKNNPLSNNGLGINLLPTYYQTDTNKKFVQSTIDQLFQQGSINKTSGYIGKQNAKSATGADVYVAARDSDRQNYQLEPGISIEDSLGNTTFFKDYIDYINQIQTFGGNVANHARLNKQEFYSWDPHINWDKFVNFQNYYWLPYGPETIRIYGQQKAITSTYTVSIESEISNNEYVFTPNGFTRNPVLRLFIGQTYHFEINSPGNPFSIKTSRSDGTAHRYVNSGIDNAGVEVGTITFTVPYDAPTLLYYQSESDLQLGGAIEILPITDDTYIDITTDILGKRYYTLPDGTALSNGMKLSFGGNVTPSQYGVGEFYVEGVGVAIQLISTKILSVVNTYTVEQTVPFDTDKFDTQPFSDATGFAGALDYITISRSSSDYNNWSRYNRWFHKDVIDASSKYNGNVASLDQVTRAVRPIIEFQSDLKLFNFGTNAIQDVNLIDDYTIDAFSTIEGSSGYNVDGIKLTQGQLIVFTADPDPLVQNKLFRVEFVDVIHLNSGSKQIHLAEVETPKLNDVILVTSGIKNQGISYWYNGINWIKSQQKTSVNQAPLFDIVDKNGISYGDTGTYNGTTFTGTKLFSYQVGTGSADNILGFPLSYLNINNIGDILFNFNLATDTFNYKQITSILTKSISVGYLVSLDYGKNIVYKNGWQLCTTTTNQAAVRIYNNSGLTNNFNVDIFDDISNLTDLVIKVYINGYRLDPSLWNTIAGPRYYQVVLTTPIKKTDILTIRAFASQPINGNGYYEIPGNLQNNPLNDVMTSFSLGEVTDHLTSIVDNIPKGFVGSMPGDNNLRDLGNVTQYGTKFVQHSGPMSLSLYHMTSESNNVVRALQETRNDYGKFKRNFITTASSLGVDGDPVTITNLVLQKLNANIPNTAPYYFSDMVPYGATLVTPLDVVDYRIKQYPLSYAFSLDTLSNKAVGIYRTHNGTTTQLVYGRDYTFSGTFFIITPSLVLSNGDILTTYEYDSTDGCFVPETPTKMGMWPAYTPQIYLDTSLVTPRLMIQGHDGSQVLAYGDYRDDLILELEKRIFNNIKVQYDASIFDINDIIPSYNRNTDYSLQEFNEVLAPNFYSWVSLTGKDFSTPVNYDINNSFTYNYSTSTSPDGNNVPGYWRGIYRYMLDTDRPNICPWEMLGFSIMPDWWIDTYGPAPYTGNNLPMWQDIANGTIRHPGKPVEYLSKYAKLFLMKHIPVNDNGNLLSPTQCGLAVGPISPSSSSNFVFGDVSPIESAWRRGSHYPYSVILTSMLLSPAKTFGLLLDRSRIKRNLAGQLIYSDTDLRICPMDITVPSIYSSTSRVQTSGLINFIVDYVLNVIFSNNIKSYGGYKSDIKSLAMNLSYRVGAFTSKEQFNLLLDSRSPLSTGSIFVPQENYNIILNSSSPVKKITYSGVIITRLNAGFEVKGYSKTEPYFYCYPYTKTGQIINVGGISESYSLWTAGQLYVAGSVVQYNGSYFRATSTLTAGPTFDTVLFAPLTGLPVTGGREANLRTAWDTETPILVPYSTQFNSIQEVVDFLLGYGKYLETQGFIFNDFNNNLGAVTNWITSVNEFLFWTTQNWSAGENKWSDWVPNQPVNYGNIVRYNGDYYSALFNLTASDIFDPLKYNKLDGLSEIGSSVISLSPSANRLIFGTKLTVVDDISKPFYDYEIVKVDGTPILPSLLNSYRNGNLVTYTTTTKDGIYGASFYLIQNEHVVLLNNTTIFNDVIYNPTSGYRQERLKVSSYVSTGWYGGLDIPGFIYDRALTTQWEPFQDYNLGDIVLQQGNYYSAKSFTPGIATFAPGSWKKLDKKPTAQILPNWTNSATQFTDFYGTDVDNFNSAQQKQAQHLIGYQKRQYLDNILQDSISEFKFYQGMIREKGTQNALNHLFGVLAKDNLESLTFYEEWAVRVGQYGAANAFQEIEFILDESKFISNPQGFKLSTSVDSTLKGTFIIQQTPNDVYLKPVGYNNQPWPQLVNYTPFLRDAGYVNPTDVFITIRSLADITKENISTFNEGAYVWVTFDNAPDFWNVYRYTDLHLDIVSVSYNAGTLIITSENIVQNVKAGSYIGLTQVSQLQGFFLVTDVELNVITLSATIKSFPSPFTPKLCEELVVFTLIPQRTKSIDTIDTILTKATLPKELLWTDDGGDGKWSVWQYMPVYQISNVLNNAPQTELKFGSSVAVNRNGTLSAVTTSVGQVIVYDKVGTSVAWTQRQVIAPPSIAKNAVVFTSINTILNSNIAVCVAAQQEWTGGIISGPGVPSNTIITSVITNTSITLGQKATSTSNGGTYTIVINVNPLSTIASTVAISTDGLWLASSSPKAGFAVTSYLGTYNPANVYGPGTIVSVVNNDIINYYEALIVVPAATQPATVWTHTYSSVTAANLASDTGNNAATFNISLTGTTYTITVNSGGAGYVINDTLTILGTKIGGTISNNIVIRVTTVSAGKITAVKLVSSNPPNYWGNLYYIPVDDYGTWDGKISYPTNTLVVYKNNVYQANESIYGSIDLLIASTLSSYTYSGTTYQYVLTTTDTSQLSIGYEIIFTGDIFGNLQVTGANGSGEIATINFPTQRVPPFLVGQTITVTEVIPTSYNGTYNVINCTTNSVSFASAATGVLLYPGKITTNNVGSLSGLIEGNTYYIANIIDARHFQITVTRGSTAYTPLVTAYGSMVGSQQPQYNPSSGNAVNPITSSPQWTNVTNSFSTIIGPAEQGVVSLYKKDFNNVYSLVDTIVSPTVSAKEYFGSSLVFGNDTLYITAPGYSNGAGRVYTLSYTTIVQVTSAYNPSGSEESTLSISSTAGVRPGMIVIGKGFTSNQTVTEVVSSKLLTLSGTADSNPAGIISFAITGWAYNYNGTFTGTINQGFGYSLALSADQSTLAISATNRLTAATVRIYKNTSGIFSLTETITTSDSNIELTISDTGKYIAIADDTVSTSQLVGQGSVNVFVYDANSETYGGYNSNAVFVTGIPYQTLTLHQPEINGHFGRKISFMNDYSTLVVFSEYGDTQVTTTYDENSTSFDKSSTKFAVTQYNSGRVDVYDRYAKNWVFSESLSKVNPVVSSRLLVPGTTYDILTVGTTDFTKIGATENKVGIRFIATTGISGTGTAAIATSESGVLDGYGVGFAVGSNHILIGAPNGIDRGLESGLVYDYQKSSGQTSWTMTQSEIAIPDVKKVKKAFLYNRVDGNLIKYIDFIDPMQGKIPGIADEEITYKAFYDPAVYTYTAAGATDTVNVNPDASWTTAQLGQLWWDLRTAKFLNVYVDDPVYRNANWNTLATGASIDIYEWVSYSGLPASWDAITDTPAGLAQGISGTSLYGNNVYSISQVFNSVTNKFTKTYYFWVKNKKYTPNVAGRHMDALDVSTLIANPRGQAYTYLALTGLNSFSLVNAKQFLQDTQVVLSVDYWLIDNVDQNVHRHWKIISDDHTTIIPESILQKWADSLCGVDSQGRTVPDPDLPPKIRYGIENRPRQGMFINRFEALKEFVDIANKTLLSNQIVENSNLSALESYDPVPNAVLGIYDATFATEAELPYASVANYAVPKLSPVIGNGRIIGATIISAGKGYLIAPYIEIIGSGTGAIVQTVIDSKGKITGVNVISSGAGYDSNTTFNIRNYSALVSSDSQADGNWSIYAYDPVNKVWSRTLTQSYDVRKFWNYTDWYGSYTNLTGSIKFTATQFTAPDFSVATLSDLNIIQPAIGETVRVRTVGSGGWLLLYKYANVVSVDWTQSYATVGIQNGTIQLSSDLYKTYGTILGFDNSIFDADGYDQYAAIELRIILNTLQNNIFINTLTSAYLDLFFDSIRYIHSEQPYVDWIFKTSFVKAEHNIGSLNQPVTYQPDNLSNFQDFVNEVKPYRTKVREYVDNYNNLDVAQLPITDFDLQPIYENGKMTVLPAYVIDNKIVSADANIRTEPWKNWLDNVGFEVTELILTSKGSGYATNPTVIISGGGGTGATAKAFITNGSVNRIILLTSGSKYLSTPTVTLQGGLAENGVAATAVAIIDNSVVRSTLIGMKFDRVDQTYVATQLEKVETFTGTANRVQFPLTWAPDVRVGQSTVTINGILVLRDSYVLNIVSSKSSGYTQYSGNITFITAPPGANANISVSYILDQSLLSATDRIQYYYNPTSGMLGKDIAQLMTGIDYGGVIVNGMNFVQSNGWDSVPYYSTGWDSFDPDYTDFSVVVTNVTHEFKLPYTPDNELQLTLYKTQTFNNSYVFDGTTETYRFNVDDVSPVVTADWTTTSAGATNIKGSSTLKVATTTGIKVGDIVSGTGLTGNPLFVSGTIVVSILDSTYVTLNYILYNTIPTGTSVTFTRTLTKSVDYIVPTTSSIKLVSFTNKNIISPKIHNVSISNTTGTFAYTSSDITLITGQLVTILGKNTGTSSILGYTIGTQYYIIGSPTSTSFQLSLTQGGAPITTIAGTVIGLTLIVSGTHISITGKLNPLRLDDPNFIIKPYIVQLINAMTYDTLFGSNLQSVQLGNDILSVVTEAGFNSAEAILSINNIVESIINIPEVTSNSSAVTAINNYSGIVKNIIDGGIVPTFIYPSPYPASVVLTYTAPNVTTVTLDHYIYLPIGAVNNTQVTAGWTVTGPGITGIATVSSVVAYNGHIAALIDLVVIEYYQSGTYTFQSPNGGNTNASILLNDNVPFIQAEMIAYITATYPSVVYNTSLFQTQMQYTVESLVYDLLYGGNSRSLYTSESASTVGFTVPPTNFTTYFNSIYTRLNSLAQSIIANTPFTPLQTQFQQYPISSLIHGAIASTTISNIITNVKNSLAGTTVATSFPTITRGTVPLQAVANSILAVKSTLIPTYNSNAIVNTFLADGMTDTFSIPNTYTVITGDEFILRQITSDGSVLPAQSDYDTALSGGDTSNLNGVYSTATGLLADDIIVDGDDFVTPTTSGAPEEVVPGQVVDTVAIKVFDTPHTGSASIKVDNYITNGTKASYALSQVPNGPGAVIVKLNGVIKTLNTDYTVNYNTQSINLMSMPPANQQLSLFSIGYSGTNILGIDYFIGDGATTEFVTNIAWEKVITSVVYVNGEVTNPVLFKTDSTYSIVDTIGLQFSSPPLSGQVINYIIVSGIQQTFSIAKVETIATNGSLTYTLQNPIGNSLPNESNMIVRVDQKILQAPNNSYFTITGNRLNYTIDPTKFVPYSVPITDISVIVGTTLLTRGTDYTVDLSGISIKITKKVYSIYKDQTLVVSVTTGNTYLYNSATQQITFANAYDNTHLVQVISYYQHDILDIQRTAINVNSSATLVENTPSFFQYQNLIGNIVPLDRYVIDQGYVWITLSGTLLSPNLDYKLNDDHLSITLYKTVSIGTTDILSIITFSSNILLPGISYMQFKDMLNRTTYKRLGTDKQTTLARDLSWSDKEIILTNATNFDLPSPANARPGIIEIAGERIEYYQVTGNVLSQLRRGTLGTGLRTLYLAGTFVQDIGTSSTIPYADTQVIDQAVSNGESNVITLSFVPKLHTYKNPVTKVTQQLPSDIEVFVGGYNDGIVWAPGVTYSVGTIVNIGSYTYRCLTNHISGSTFFGAVTTVTINIDGSTTTISENISSNIVWKFFIGNIRLKKNSYTVFNVNKGSYSPAGDVTFPADFTIDGTTATITLTNLLTAGTQITVIQNKGTAWDSSVDILYDTGVIADFLRAAPGIAYSQYNKIGNKIITSSSTVSTFDSGLGTLDNGNITFDRG